MSGKNMFWSGKIDELLSLGQSLESYGILNYALSRDDALDALDKLEVMGVAILGGDVYFANDGVYSLSYDNWYCDPIENITDTEYTQLSISLAKKYIQRYPIDGAFFALVPKMNMFTMPDKL